VLLRPPKDIVDAVRHGKLCFASGKLKELHKWLPDDMEVNWLSLVYMTA